VFVQVSDLDERAGHARGGTLGRDAIRAITARSGLRPVADEAPVQELLEPAAFTALTDHCLE
jgi:hypothetical protein